MNASFTKAELGEPVLAEEPNELIKSRKVMMLISCITLFSYFAQIRVSSGNLLGLSINNVSEIWVYRAVLAVLIYLFVKFLVLSLEYYWKVGIRLTGCDVKFITFSAFEESSRDAPDDPQQSSLYVWWQKNKPSVKELNATLQKLLEIEQKVGDQYDTMSKEGKVVSDWRTNLLKEIKAAVSGLRKTNDALETDRISASLERFDRSFRCFSGIQVARFMIFDVLLPVMLWLGATVVCVCRIIEIPEAEETVWQYPWGIFT